MPGYTAYIDESGCDGFDFENGSSDFLVLGAVVCRTSRLSDMQDVVTRAKKASRKPPGYTFKSFKKLNTASAQRWCIAKHLAEAPCQVVAVAVYKPGLTEKGWKQDKSDLYFQASKFLSERVSWACRDTHTKRAEPEPACRIVFSNRKSLRYEDFRKYLQTLRSDPQKYSSNADWNHLVPEEVTDQDHDDTNPMMLAVDHFASAIGCALELKDHGQFDDRYARLWHPRFYSSEGLILGNGMKVWPNDGLNMLKSDPRGGWMRLAMGL